MVFVFRATLGGAAARSHTALDAMDQTGVRHQGRARAFWASPAEVRGWKRVTRRSGWAQGQPAGTFRDGLPPPWCQDFGVAGPVPVSLYGPASCDAEITCLHPGPGDWRTRLWSNAG